MTTSRCASYCWRETAAGTRQSARPSARGRRRTRAAHLDGGVELLEVLLVEERSGGGVGHNRLRGASEQAGRRAPCARTAGAAASRVGVVPREPRPPPRPPWGWRAISPLALKGLVRIAQRWHTQVCRRDTEAQS